MQIVKLEIDSGFFYCPITGKTILDPELFNESEATVFAYIEDEGEFAMVAPWIQKIWNKLAKDKSGELFERLCKELTSHSNLVLFSFISRGWACGPTAHICIDFAYKSCDPEKDTAGNKSQQIKPKKAVKKKAVKKKAAKKK